MDITPFWVVWSPRGQRPPSHKHVAKVTALAEAKRLSLKHPGRHFYVLEVVAYEMEGPEVPTEKQQEKAARKSAGQNAQPGV